MGKPQKGLLPGISARVSEIRAAKGWTWEEMAHETGLSASSLNDLSRGGDPTPSAYSAYRIAEAGGRSLEWLLTGQEGDGTRRTAEVETAYGAEEVQRMGVYGLAGAGPAWDVEAWEPVEEILVPRRLCRPSIVPIKVKGRSMEPTIFDGAYVGIDKDDRRVVSGEVYAVWLPNEGAVVKRLYADPLRLALVSDNPAFPKAEIPAGNVADNLVLGRVRWVVQEF